MSVRRAVVTALVVMVTISRAGGPHPMLAVAPTFVMMMACIIGGSPHPVTTIRATKVMMMDVDYARADGLPRLCKRPLAGRYLV